MQPPKTREIVRQLEAEGFVRLREKGGRRIYQRGSQIVTIHGSDNHRPTKGTFGAIKRQAGW